MSSAKYRIAIAGAGIAGLAAGILLQKAGYAVQILESGAVSGGRIQSQTMNGYLIEAGPEFIHGNARETIRLLKKYHIPFVRSDGKMYSVRDGQLLETGYMNGEWDKLLIQMKKLKNDLPFGEFLLKYFPGKDHHEVRESAIRFAEGFDLADIKTASTQALAEEWLSGESMQYRIPGGYYTLVQSMENEFISAGGKILFQHVVDSVDWTANEIRVGVNGHQLFMMDKLIISLPVSMLNPVTTDIQRLSFNPSPEKELKTFAQIGYGTVVKLAMIWQSAFWKTRIPDAQFIFSDCFIPAWWTQYPHSRPLLTGWLGGPAAAVVSQQADSYFLEKGLESLSTIFSVSVSELKSELVDFRVFNWAKEPWSRGAYSYATVESKRAKILSRKSWDRRIYFAGEAFYEGPHPGTVEAALVSSLDTARQLLAEI
jgi:monoamine oxidase